MEPDHTDSEQRLLSVLASLHARQSIARLLADVSDGDRLAQRLQPLVDAGAVIDSIAGGPERVDATLSAGDGQWRVVFGYAPDGRITWLDVYERPLPFDGVPGGRIVVVNGPSGAGKSTLMRALQAAAQFPLVVLDEPEQVGTVQPGYMIWRNTAPSLHRGYLAAAAALAAAGNHVALSAGGHSYVEVVEAFAGVPLVSVGMTCELDVLVQREQRTGRWAGIAAASLDVHDGWLYELEFDTTDGPGPAAMAAEVLAKL